MLANPRGFCAGVERAIEIVKVALNIYGAPIYVFHELVHNRYVVNSLRKRGVFFINDINKAPNGSILVFSAHGVSKTVRIKAMQRSLNILDATCPLVAKVHMEMLHASIKGKEAILIGHSGHPEVEGTIGQYSNLFGNVHLVESENDVWSLKVNHINDLCYMTQTTLSIFETKKIIRALKIRFPNIAGPKKDDICYATTNRQNAVRVLVDKVDIVFVVGSKKSSNSNRLMEVARYYGKLAYLIEDDTDIDISWLNNMNIIGITAGASTPNFLVNKVIDRLVVFSKQNCVVEELVGEEEKVFFKLPRKCLIKV